MTLGSILSGITVFLPFVAQATTDGPWQTMGLGAIAAGLVGYLVKQNTDLGKAQAEHQKELVKLVADMSISQTVFAEAVKDIAVSENALANALQAVAKAFERNTAQISKT